MQIPWLRHTISASMRMTWNLPGEHTGMRDSASLQPFIWDTGFDSARQSTKHSYSRAPVSSDACRGPLRTEIGLPGAHFAASVMFQANRRNEQMRRLRLQMQVSIDGMVAGQRGPARFNWDEEVRHYSIDNARQWCRLIF